MKEHFPNESNTYSGPFVALTLSCFFLYVKEQVCPNYP